MYTCTVLTGFQHTKLSPNQDLSPGFIHTIFLKFCKFRPSYSYKKEKSGEGMRSRRSVILQTVYRVFFSVTFYLKFNVFFPIAMCQRTDMSTEFLLSTFSPAVPAKTTRVGHVHTPGKGHAQLCCNRELNLLSPNIHIQILQPDLYIFP